MKLSICMMVKNESKHLEECLQSLQPIRDAISSELVIVDTGSEDNTVEIAKKYTDKVHFHEWNNDFSGMRNITIQYARGEWIMIIDGDEVLQKTQPIIDFLRSRIDKKVGAVVITGNNVTDMNNPEAFSIILTPRLFKNDGYFHYSGVVHNQPVFKGKMIEIPATLLHYGYVANDKELMEKKFLRTSSLLRKELDKNPENIYYWYQLSVSYAMYGDWQQAKEIIEKAYELLPKQLDKKQCMYVYTHLAHVYQITKNYPKLEEICLESLLVKEGYIDIYFYLAEAQAILEKDHQAIETYTRYLDLLETNDYASKYDTAVIDYMTGQYEQVYFNLALLCRKVGNYTQALYFAKKVIKKEDVRRSLHNIIFLFIKEKQYDDLRSYYADVIEESERTHFHELLEKTKNEFDQESKLAVATVFADIQDMYGLLSRMMVEDQAGEFSDSTLKEISQLDISQIPLYCCEIVYFLLKQQYPLHELLVRFKEIWLNCLVDGAAKRREDLSKVLYEYLMRYPQCETMSEYKLSKTLCRYGLLLNKFGEDEYKIIFDRYVQDGIAYLKLIYKQTIIEENLVYEARNDEEVFLLYMYQAQQNKGIDQIEYVSYLHKAMDALPTLKRGFELLLNELQAADNQQNSEMEEYKTLVKTTIRHLLEESKLEDAKTVIDEYKNMITDDLEIVLMESELMMKSAAQKQLVQ